MTTNPGGRRTNETNREWRLALYSLGGIALAGVLAIVGPAMFGEGIQRLVSLLEVGGEVYLRMLEMVAVPLVMFGVIGSMLDLGDIGKLRRPITHAVTYYLVATAFAVMTGLIVVNMVKPGLGIDKTLVEGARKEGEMTVRRTARKVEWPNLAGDRTQAAGVSKSVSVPAGGPWNIWIVIDQVSDAETAARAQVEWSAAGNRFQPAVNGEFVAGTKEGVYRATSPVALPEDASYARVVFTPESATKDRRSIVEAYLVSGPSSIGEILQNLILMFFTGNILASLITGNLLPLIVFSMVFGGTLASLGDRAGKIADLVHSTNYALTGFVLLVLRFAPLGSFCLLSAMFINAQLEGRFREALHSQFWYVTSVLLGLAVHCFVFLALLLWLFARRNATSFIRQMSVAVFTAFATASTTAALPVAMKCTESQAGISHDATKLVLPLGATIGVDGSALYNAVAALFVAQAYSVIDPTFVLTFDKQLVIAITASLAALGSSGTTAMLVVLREVGLPLELIGLVLSFDWLLNRFRAAANVFSASVASAIVDRQSQTSCGLPKK